jgi:(p)ppGpp synthase/HD superfamily hydrolase
VNSSHATNGSGLRQFPRTAQRPGWISGSPLLIRAYALAAEIYGAERRTSDDVLVLTHVIEVAELLHDAGCDQTLVAAALLHTAVERGALSEKQLRAEIGDRVADLVLALTEDAKIKSFFDRKQALRRKIEAAGSPAVTVFAAENLSDVRALRRGIDTQREALEQRLGTTAEELAGDYRESVAMIEEAEPDSEFVAELRAALSGLPVR